VTWVKLDDALPEDPRWDLTGPLGLALHVAALAFCSRNQTNGVLSRVRTERLLMLEDPAEVVTQLVKHGFWVERGTQIEIVGYLDDQPSAEDTERTRGLSRARQRRQRQHRSGDHSLCDPDYCKAAARESRVTDGVTNGTPSRPVPSRPEGTGDGSKAASARAPKGSHGAAAQGKETPRGFTVSGPPPVNQLCDEHGKDRTTCNFCRQEAKV
jgi:hypothetical protein